MTTGVTPEASPRPRISQLRLLVPLGLAMALSLTGDSTLYAVLPDETRAAGITMAVVGILLAANRLVRIPGNLVAGALYDRFGRRRLFLAGLVLGALSTLGYSAVRGFWPLLGTRVLWGVAWSLINVGGYTMIMDCSSPRDRGRMMGIYQLAFALGLAVSPILGGGLTDAIGFRTALRLCAALSGLGAVIAIVALPETRSGAATSVPAGPLAWREWLQGLVPAARRMDGNALRVRYVYLAVFFVNGGIMMSTLSLYVRERWGQGIPLEGRIVGVATAAGALLALRSLVAMVAGPLAGTASDHQRWTGPGAGLRGRWPVVWIGLVLGIAGFLVLGIGNAAWTTVLGVVLGAGGAGASIAGVTALSGDLAAKGRPGAAMGSMAAAGDLGSATGPLVAYALAPTIGLGWLYVLGAVVLVSGLVVCARLSAAPVLPDGASWTQGDL